MLRVLQMESGNAIAQRLAKEGASVAVVDIDEENINLTARNLESYGVKSIPYVRDLTKIKEIGSLYSSIIEDFGTLDIVVNSAGVISINSFLDTTEAEWDFLMNLNAKTLFFSVKEAAKRMKEIGQGGRIINISSITGKSSRPDYPVYAASKAAVNSITRSAAAAFADSQIKVNAVCPGYVSTSMWDQIDDYYIGKYNRPKGEAIDKMLKRIPLNRSGELHEIASLVAYLASSEADYITGQSINVDGGAVMH